MEINLITMTLKTFMQIIDDINNDKYKIRYIWYGDYITIYVNEEEVISLNVKKYKDENYSSYRSTWTFS